MPAVQLDKNVFAAAQQRASEAGYPSVDDFVADVVAQSLCEETERFDHIFTPERTAELEQISAAIKAGARTYTAAEVEEHFERKRKEWLARHAT